MSILLSGQDDDARKAEWLEQRRHRVTSTEIPILFGLGYEGTSPHLLMAQKLGIAPDIEDNQSMRLGRLFEDDILEEYTFLTGRAATLAPPWTLHNGPGVVSASIDATEDATGDLVELKKTIEWVADPDDIPQQWLLQTQAQMLCLGKVKAHLAVLVRGCQVNIFTLEADADVQEEILRVAAEFWERVVRREQPPVRSWQDYPGVRAMFPEVRRESVVLGLDAEEIMAELQSARAAESQAKREKEYAQARLAAMLGDAELGHLPSGGRPITWKANKNGSRVLRIPEAS